MILSNKYLEEKASLIRFFFSDVDGTLTDATSMYSDKGEQLKKFSFRDGAGFYILSKIGIEAGFITGENSEIVMRRAEKLKLKYCFMGISNKYEHLNNFLLTQGLDFENLAYIGDDLNDYKVLSQCGLSFCPADAAKQIKSVANIVCESKGGEGAFREAVEHFIDFKGIDPLVLF